MYLPAAVIASHDSSEDYTIISVKKADFIDNAWLYIQNRKGFHFSANWKPSVSVVTQKWFVIFF